MNIEQFAKLVSKRWGYAVTPEDARQYLDDTGRTIDEALAMFEENERYSANLKQADLPETDTEEGKLHYAKLTEPFT